jgi:hypothetical protein
MNEHRYGLLLDREMLPKVNNYYIYRSEEQENNRPIIDGVYIQSNELSQKPPKKMTLILKW